MTLHGRQGADLFRLGQCELVRSAFPSTGRDLDSALAMSYFAELLDAFAQEGEAEDAVYRLALAVLAVAGDGGDIAALTRYLEAWLLRLHGIYPSLDRCAGCDRGLPPGALPYHANAHGFVCDACGPASGPVLSGALRDALREVFRKPPVEVTTMPGDAGVLEAFHRELIRGPPRARPALASRPARRQPGNARMTLQDIIAALQKYWAERGCLIHQPWDAEVGAGTMHPETFLRVLGREPWRVAYVQPTRRPADGRYGDNPNRLYKHHQFQVILKPAPADVQSVVPRQPRGPRHRSRRPRRALRRGQLGVADPRRVGHRLAGDARRPGDHAVHVLPAGGRHRPRSHLGRDHVRAGADRDVPAGRGRRVRRGVGARRDLPPRAARGGVPALALLVRARGRGHVPRACSTAR